MIVGIIKIGTGLVALEEVRKADSEALAVSEFCNECTPVLTPSDYLGVNGDPLDLQSTWVWAFSQVTLVIKRGCYCIK